jgi:multisubunit Na+/H+ antiporter MnhF subunit
VTAAFLAAAIAMLVALIPAGVTIARGDTAEAVVAYQFLTSVAVMVLALIAQGFGRAGLFEFPVVLAVLLYGSGLVFARAVEDWL